MDRLAASGEVSTQFSDNQSNMSEIDRTNPSSDDQPTDKTVELHDVEAQHDDATQELAVYAIDQQIGPYRILEKLGEGGMGTVYLAEQRAPVRRRVALKIIKPGMDTGQVIARFEAERQALAMMDHPNIARVFDGGVTEHGRPYFAMENVKGVPLTEYCDDSKLSVRERLKLFIPICHAVQHAHQKGIIHRDLKPSNILICLFDGKPIPKVIDFGLAKAMNQSLTERTVYTAHGMMVGTPLYMSPEQAEFNNLDIDTRTDVYALGVILYELLTGTTPLERAQITKAAHDEVLRLIKHFDPPKPSVRLNSSQELPRVAAQRRIEPEQLSRRVTGDLDWVVMKSLEKERSRRYETANGLAEDLHRHLSDEPVSAGPPSARYRMQKFVKRNRAGVLAVGAIVTAMLLGVAGTTAGMLWALSERDVAEAAREAESKARAEATSNAELASEEAVRASKAEQRIAATLRQVEAARDARESINRRLKRMFGIGEVDIRVSQGRTPFVNLDDISSLKEGDAIRIGVRFGRPYYCYVFWVGSSGEATVLYPDDPERGTRNTEPVTELSSPVEFDSGWPILSSGAGMESLVVVASLEPIRQIPHSLLPVSTEDVPARAIRFENGSPVVVYDANSPFINQHAIYDLHESIAEQFEGAYVFGLAVVVE